MSKHKINLGDSLMVASPDQSDLTTISTHEPKLFDGMNILLPVNEINCFEDNPRKHRDEESYQLIKESIKNIGIQQPVHVTHRPNSTQYVLARGGNTRLTAIRELFEETKNDKYSKIPAIFVEFTSEQDLRISHLIENEQRNDMCFWDKACAYAEGRDGFTETSSRDLAKAFGKLGLTITHVTLSLYFFAHDYLSELNGFAAKLSRSKALELRGTYNDLKKLFPDQSNLEQFDTFWFSTLAKWVSQQTNTDVDWSSKELCSFIQVNYETNFGVNPVYNEAPPEKNNSGADKGLTDDNPEANQEPNHIEVSETGAVARTSIQQKTSVEAEVDAESSIQEQPLTDTKVTSGDSPSFVGVDPQQAEPHATNLTPSESLYSAVKALLSAVGLNECFTPNDGFPYGFYIEFPNLDDLVLQDDDLYPIDRKHKEAKYIFASLLLLTKQEELFSNTQLNDQNPFMLLNNDSLMKKAFENPDFDDVLRMQVGYETSSEALAFKMLKWQTESGELHTPFCNALNAFFNVNNK